MCTRFKLLFCCAALLGSTFPAHAGWMDSLFGKSTEKADASQAAPGQRIWRVNEFSTVELVPREPGAAANQQPVQLQPDALLQQLALVRTDPRTGGKPLFGGDELGELIPPLVQALGRAGPGDDVLLTSSSRRDTGILMAPTAVTARLFVQGDGLQIIVHDARFDFYDTYRGTERMPRFVFGSRTAAGGATLQSAGAANRRADWLSIPLQMASLSAQPTAAAAGPVPAVASPVTAGAAVFPQPAAATPAATMPMPMPAAAAPSARRPPLDAAGAEDIERRLETIKRLRDKGLISEDEYVQKRKEILQLL